MSFGLEEAHLVDHIQAAAFFQAKGAGASFITKLLHLQYYRICVSHCG